MYSREVDGATRRFGVSGKLWHGVLVLLDRETGTLWTQLDGRAIRGEDAGARLAHVPSVHTTWERWRAAHPDTLALAKDDDARARSGSRYADYLADPERLFQPRLAEGIGDVGPKAVVFGVVAGGEALAVEEELLAERGVVNVVVGGTPVSLHRDPATGAVTAHERRLGERVLVLAPLRDASPAELARDLATGEVRGTDELRALRVDRAFWYAWARTHPGSAVLAR